MWPLNTVAKETVLACVKSRNHSDRSLCSWLRITLLLPEPTSRSVLKLRVCVSSQFIVLICKLFFNCFNDAYLVHLMQGKIWLSSHSLFGSPCSFLRDYLLFSLSAGFNQQHIQLWESVRVSATVLKPTQALQQNTHGRPEKYWSWLTFCLTIINESCDYFPDLLKCLMVL